MVMQRNPKSDPEQAPVVQKISFLLGTNFAQHQAHGGRGCSNRKGVYSIINLNALALALHVDIKLSIWGTCGLLYNYVIIYLGHEQ